MALQVVCLDGFLKGDPDFILVINNYNKSIMHRFRYNQVLPLSGNDVIVISPLGALKVIHWSGFWKDDPDFILVFDNIHTSIMQSFRFNQVLPLACKLRHSVISARGRYRQIINLDSGRATAIFILVLNSSYRSILHRFRFIQVLPFDRNDVVLLSPLGGAAGRF